MKASDAKPAGPADQTKAGATGGPKSASAAPAAVNVEYVERCQIEYERNPRSRIFAPLTEAYRKMGMLPEALRIGASGVSFHPDFAGGRVAYAKCLIEKRSFAEALAQLEKAAELSPDNLLAHSLMGETLLELRRPKEALRAFKMALFLNPNDERARQTVRKWEFLTADEYDADLFVAEGVGGAAGLFSEAVKGAGAREPRPEDDRVLASLPPKASSSPPALERELERAISLADAFTVRNNLESAMQVLRSARERLGSMPELDNRLALLERRTQVLEEAPTAIRPKAARERENSAADLMSQAEPDDRRSEALEAASGGELPTGPLGQRKVTALRALLSRIRDRRRDDEGFPS